jgi:large subunit ribosomal protein L35
MPKHKTHKGLSKRVKVTASGKVKRKRCNGGHLMSGKSAKRRRRIGADALVSGAKAQSIKTALGL